MMLRSKTIACGKSYLASITDMDMPLSETGKSSVGKVLDEETSAAFLPVKNAGCFGASKGIVSLLNIEITSGIVGLSIALSCTHNRPTWIVLSN